MQHSPLQEAREGDGQIKKFRTFLSAWSLCSCNWIPKGWLKIWQFVPGRGMGSSHSLNGTKLEGSSLQMWWAFCSLGWTAILWFCVGSLTKTAVIYPWGSASVEWSKMVVTTYLVMSWGVLVLLQVAFPARCLRFLRWWWQYSKRANPTVQTLNNLYWCPICWCPISQSKPPGEV